MRAFIALDLPLNIKNAVSEIQGKLKALLPKISWTKPENLHITLKFLGEISPKQSGDIKQIITEVTKTTSVFKIKFETLSVFPDIKRPRLIWIGTNQVPPELKQIVEQLELKIARTGIPKENRQFSNHVTVGRIKNNIDPAELEEALNKVRGDLINRNLALHESLAGQSATIIGGLEFDAVRITLFQSTLGAAGPTYTALNEANFRIT